MLALASNSSTCPIRSNPSPGGTVVTKAIDGHVEFGASRDLIGALDEDRRVPSKASPQKILALVETRLPRFQQASTVLHEFLSTEETTLNGDAVLKAAARALGSVQFLKLADDNVIDLFCHDGKQRDAVFARLVENETLETFDRSTGRKVPRSSHLDAIKTELHKEARVPLRTAFARLVEPTRDDCRYLAEAAWTSAAQDWSLGLVVQQAKASYEKVKATALMNNCSRESSLMDEDILRWVEKNVNDSFYVVTVIQRLESPATGAILAAFQHREHAGNYARQVAEACRRACRAVLEQRGYTKFSGDDDDIKEEEEALGDDPKVAEVVEYAVACAKGLDRDSDGKDLADYTQAGPS